MRGRRWVPVATALVVAVAMSSASAAPADRDGHHPLGGSVSTTTEPGGSSTVTSGDYSNDVRSADLFFDAPSYQSDLFKATVFALRTARAVTTRGTKTNRLVACAAMSASYMEYVRDRLLDSSTSSSYEEIQATAGTRGAAYALMCMNMARLMAEIEAEGEPARPSARRSPCDVLPVKVKVRTERTEDGGFHLVPYGTITDGTGALAVKATCTGRGTKLTMHIAPKKKVPLNKVAGKNIVVGVASPSSASGNVDVTVGFKGR